jgi:MFS family permease
MGDAGGFAAMVGIGETYIAAYALALGMGEVIAAMIVALPMLAGAYLQLSAPWVVGRFNSRRRFVVACATLQATSLLLLPLVAFTGNWKGPLLFLGASLYWAGGLATAPVWNTWIEDIVPVQVRKRFFANRGRISQICMLAGFVLGGVLLQVGKGADAAGAAHTIRWELAAFAALFLVAAVSRYVSAWCLSRQSEPSAGKLSDRRVGWREWRFRLRSDSGARLVLYLMLVQVAVQISGPYFTPFMLQDLHFTYLHYMLLIGMAFLAKVVTFPFWGRLSKRIGARGLLWVGGLTIVPIPAFCVLGNNFYYLCAVQVFSGVSWAAYELALLLMFFDSIPRNERTSMLTIYNFGNAAALVIGFAIGWGVFEGLGKGHVAYLAVFGLSAAARLASTAYLTRVPSVQRSREEALPALPGMLTVRNVSGPVVGPALAIPKADLQEPKAA